LEASCLLERLKAFLEAASASWERLGGVLERLGGVLERLGGVLDPLGGVLEASWSVLEASWSLLERLGALLKMIWPDAENVEKPLVFLCFWRLGRSWKRLGDVLEASGSVLKTAWSCLGAAATDDAAFDAAAAASELL
jgi:hypothetical protein